jgi:hypothetical protein
MSQASKEPGTLRNLNNVAVASDDGFTAVKKAKAE